MGGIPLIELKFARMPISCFLKDIDPISDKPKIGGLGVGGKGKGKARRPKKGKGKARHPKREKGK